MRIGILTTSYPRFADDWAGRFVAESAAWLAGRGDHVDVLAPSPACDDHDGVRVHPIRYARRPRLCYGAGAPDNLLGESSWNARLGAWAQVPPFVANLAMSFRRLSGGWDGVVSHWLIPCGAVPALSRPSLRHLAVAHSSEVHLLRRLPGGPWLLARFARSRCALVLTSESLREPLLDLVSEPDARRWIERAEVARMGIEPPPDAPEADVALPEKGRFRVLFVGRLVPVKGLRTFLRACAGLPAELVVVGDGPEREDLEAEARRLGVEARFVGEQGHRRKWEWLRAADLLVLPSRVLLDRRTESAPMVLLEALAAGLPVVASRVGGVDELVEDGVSGLLVPPESDDALRRALVRLIEDPSLRGRLGEAGRARAASYSWDAVGGRLREILTAL